MHRLLMERGDIIDRLIATKKTAETGSAFRPAREADMMRRLVERHRGILPLDTAESIWRVIIATFTYVQAPFSVHADLSPGDAAMRDTARFHFGFTVPFVPHGRGRRGRGGCGLARRHRPGAGGRRSGAWWTALEADDAPKIIARLPFVERADHPAGLPVFGIARPNPDAIVTDVETWSVRVSGWGPAVARSLDPSTEVIAVPDRAFDGAALLVSVPQGGIDVLDAALVNAGARCARRPSSAATRPVIRSPPKAGPPAADRLSLESAMPSGDELPNALALAELDVVEMSVSERPQPRPGVLKIQAYVPGKSSAPGVAKVFKLSSNETPLGASPKAIAAYNAVGAHLHDYPDGAATELREAIGRTYGLDPERIVCGAGSDDLLNLLARAYLQDGDEAIHTTHGFLVYPIATLGAGATPVVAAEKEFTADVDAILATVTPRTKIVFLANPNNPTGTYIPFDEVKRLHAGLPKHVLLVIDAAYAEYVRRNDYESGIELVATSENVVMTRTFSKIYGLAALRLGWLYGPAHVVDAVNRIRGPFNVGAPSIAAGVAAIADVGHVERSREHNEKWLAWTHRRNPQARPEGDAERRQLHPDPFPRNQGQDREGRRRVAHLARPRDARGRRLSPAERAAHDRRHRGGEPAVVATLAELMGKKG